MESIIHKNIVRFFGVHDIKIGGSMVKAIITELMEGGSVESFLNKASKASIKPMDIVSMGLDTAIGMRYLHENDIIHRDLAARNLLLSSNRGKYIVKVSDFGLSRQIPSEREFNKTAPSLTLDLNSDKNPTKWTAPEVFRRGRVSSRSDLWSFGVVLYELFTFCKVTPYEDFTNKAIIKKLNSGKEMYKYLSIPDCPEGVQELLNSCLSNNPKARPVFNKIIHSLEEIQERVKANNSWKIEEDNNTAIPIDLGSGTYDSSTSSEEDKGSAEVQEDKGAARRSPSTREGESFSLSGHQIGSLQVEVDGDVQFDLGLKHLNGMGVAKDYKKASEYFEEAAKRGHASAQYNLGYMYQKGDGVKKDYQRARSLYEQAAKQGHSNAQNSLGYMYDTGLGLNQQDYEEAVKWYKKAADQGHADAQFMLGNMYADGAGVMLDPPKALFWYEKAAKQGHARAQISLMEMSSSTIDTSNSIPAVINRPSQEWLSLKRVQANKPLSKERDWTRAPEIQTIDGHTGDVTTLTELSDGLLASGSEDNTIKIWDRSGNCITTLEGHTGGVFTLIELSDGLLASGSYDKTIKIWDRSGNCINTLDGHTGDVTTLTELLDGLLASGSGSDEVFDGTIKIWDRSGNCIKTLEGDSGGVKTLIELPDGLLASGGGRSIKIWDRLGNCINSFEKDSYVCTLLSDGLLASGSYDKTIKIWDRSGKCITTLEGHTGGVLTLIELSDGLLASGSYDKTIKIWDRLGNCINNLEGHRGYVCALIELSDGLLASGSEDNTIKIWDRSGNCINTLEGHTRDVNRLIELSDGRLASGSTMDNTIKTWDFPRLN
jgi:TPR repeat protein